MKERLRYVFSQANALVTPLQLLWQFGFCTLLRAHGDIGKLFAPLLATKVLHGIDARNTTRNLASKRSYACHLALETVTLAYWGCRFYMMRGGLAAENIALVFLTAAPNLIEACTYGARLVFHSFLELLPTCHDSGDSCCDLLFSALRERANCKQKFVSVSVDADDAAADGECAICLQALQPANGKVARFNCCKHAYHLKCLKLLLSCCDRCPMCRTLLTSRVSATAELSDSSLCSLQLKN